MAHRSFGQTPPSTAVEPISFDLPGEEPGTVDSYTCLTDPPGGAFLDIGATADRPGPGQSRAMVQFLDLVLEDDSAARFAAAMRRKANPITMDALIDVFTWLVGEFSSGRGGQARPTSGPSALPSGPAGTGPSSTAGAPAAVSTP